MKRFKKILFETHRVSGSLLSLMFFIWFLSGIVLLFQGFPHASRQERFLNLPIFTKDVFTNILPPPTHVEGRVELELLDSKPVYRVYNDRKKQEVYDATTLESISFFSEDDARRLCYLFRKSNVKEVILKEELDQWIPWSYYKPLLPFYKCYLDDNNHTVLYISQKTGNILQETTRKTRWSARLGAIPHWVYFSRLRQNATLWKNVIITLSVLGLIACLSGLVVGFILMVRKKWLTPYKKKWYKWHHITGYIFGLFVFTFLLSGLLSVINIPNWMVLVKNKEKISWKHPSTSKDAYNYSPQIIYNSLIQKEGVRRIAWTTIFDTPHYFVYYDSYKDPEVYKQVGDTILFHKEYSLQKIKTEVEQRFSGKSFKVLVQKEFDSYYKFSGMSYHPIPVYRVDFNDEAKSSLYINPKTAEKVILIDNNRRFRRWLYRGLHTFNLKIFDNAEWLRKLVIILISIGGLALSVTSLILSFKWVRRKKRKYKKKKK